jgi:hypothetical protein
VAFYAAQKRHAIPTHTHHKSGVARVSHPCIPTLTPHHRLAPILSYSPLIHDHRQLHLLSLLHRRPQSPGHPPNRFAGGILHGSLLHPPNILVVSQERSARLVREDPLVSEGNHIIAVEIEDEETHPCPFSDVQGTMQYPV